MRALISALFATVSVAVQAAAPIPQADPKASAVVIRSGDVFDMRLGGVPPDIASEYALQYSVGSEGTVNVPLVGEIKVSGLTPSEVERRVQAKMIADKIFTHPSVMIVVSPAARFVSVGGGVKMPQRMQWSADLTLSTSISGAGGLDDYGKEKGIRLIRDGKVVERYDLHLLQKDPSRDPKLLPGDQVYVPK